MTSFHTIWHLYTAQSGGAIYVYYQRIKSHNKINWPKHVINSIISSAFNNAFDALTWIRASVSFVRCASSSRVYMSGYCVLSKAFSSSSNWWAVNVVRDRRCLRFTVIPGSIVSSSDSSVVERANHQREKNRKGLFVKNYCFLIYFFLKS